MKSAAARVLFLVRERGGVTQAVPAEHAVRTSL